MLVQYQLVLLCHEITPSPPHTHTHTHSLRRKKSGHRIGKSLGILFKVTNLSERKKKMRREVKHQSNNKKASLGTFHAEVGAQTPVAATALGRCWKELQQPQHQRTESTHPKSATTPTIQQLLPPSGCTLTNSYTYYYVPLAVITAPFASSYETQCSKKTTQANMSTKHSPYIFNWRVV